jgi:hypothetical protein
MWSGTLHCGIFYVVTNASGESDASVIRVKIEHFRNMWTVGFCETPVRTFYPEGGYRKSMGASW